MLKTKNTTLIVIDVQEKLFEHIQQREIVSENIQKIVRGAKVLGLPIIWCEQLPEKLGATLAPIAALLDDENPITKSTFSCCGNKKFDKALLHNGTKHVLLAGIETHVCVYQTGAQLAEDGYDVQVLADCTSSRTVKNHEIGLHRLQHAEASLTSVETALLELLRDAGDARFKEILGIIK
jgi:nicotinamidase-related amidase